MPGLDAFFGGPASFQNTATAGPATSSGSQQTGNITFGGSGLGGTSVGGGFNVGGLITQYWPLLLAVGTVWYIRRRKSK